MNKLSEIIIITLRSKIHPFKLLRHRFTSLTPPQDLFHPFIRILSFIKLEIPTSLGRVALKAKRSRATISVNNNRAAGKSIVPHRCFISLCRSRDFSASNLHDLVWKKKRKKEREHASMGRQYKRYDFIRELVHQRRQFLGGKRGGGCAPSVVAFDASL